VLFFSVFPHRPFEMFSAALATLVFLPSAAVGNQIKLCQIFDEF